MRVNRREFGVAGLAGIAFAGLAQRSAAQNAAETYRNEVPGYGPLVADRDGFFDLPAGFSYTIVSAAGEAMDDGYVTPGNFDGMACFPLDGHRVALVRNHELKLETYDRGPTGGLHRLKRRLLTEPHFDVGKDGRPLPGGTSTIVYDLRKGRRESVCLSLTGTAVNCAGGATPWGSWLSCEETMLAAPDSGRSHGWVFEVPARYRGLVDPVPLTAMGRFRHEAAAVDPASGIVYLTEDQSDGLFYRFIPKVPGALAQGGRLQALALRDTAGADLRNWDGAGIEIGTSREVHWIDLEETDSPRDDLRMRGRAAGAATFARGEGIHQGSGEFYFTCTSGGAAKLGQVMRYRPGSGMTPDRIELFVESRDAAVLDYADNLTIAPWGDLIVCEDVADGRTNHLKGVTPEGRVYTLARLNADTELAGVCFAPDGKTMFVNAYHPGRTLAIRGPWDRIRPR